VFVNVTRGKRTNRLYILDALFWTFLRQIDGMYVLEGCNPYHLLRCDAICMLDIHKHFWKSTATVWNTKKNITWHTSKKPVIFIDRAVRTSDCKLLLELFVIQFSECMPSDLNFWSSAVIPYMIQTCSQTLIQCHPYLAPMKLCESKFCVVTYFDLPPSISQNQLRWTVTLYRDLTHLSFV
jgi:hypothetical protein